MKYFLHAINVLVATYHSAGAQSYSQAYDYAACAAVMTMASACAQQAGQPDAAVSLSTQSQQWLGRASQQAQRDNISADGINERVTKTITTLGTVARNEGCNVAVARGISGIMPLCFPR